MRLSIESKSSDKRPHWTVLTNYKFRAISFALTFIVSCSHLWGKESGTLIYYLLALQFLVYPHLVHLWAKRARDSRRAELNNLTLDIFVIGGWMAALHFPAFFTFTIWLSCLMNLVISRGSRGIVIGTIAFASGVMTSILLFGFQLSPDSEWISLIMCGVVMSTYLLLQGMASYRRNQQFIKTRKLLRKGEETLSEANADLKKQLEEIQSLQIQLSELAIRDPLTGLFNRRYLDDVILREIARCRREKKPFSLMMIDLDHFKSINDTYGHQGGDEVIKKLAAQLLEKVRTSDLACRYGGEEFLILLPNMSKEIAVSRANQWRSDFASTAIMFGETSIQTTMSIGIATYPDHGETQEDLIRNADIALYRAKLDGRNRAVLFDKNIE